VLNLGDPHALEDWMLRLMILKYGTLAEVACIAIFIGAPIAFASWWLRTMPGERLVRALVFINRHAPIILIGVAAIVALAQLESAFGSGNPLIALAVFGVSYLLMTAWQRWIQPGIERRLAASFKV
jgi:ABC-type spermidine/putrescine transport system permease subunit II